MSTICKIVVQLVIIEVPQSVHDASDTMYHTMYHIVSFSTVELLSNLWSPKYHSQLIIRMSDTLETSVNNKHKIHTNLEVIFNRDLKQWTILILIIHHNFKSIFPRLCGLHGSPPNYNPRRDGNREFLTFAATPLQAKSPNPYCNTQLKTDSLEEPPVHFRCKPTDNSLVV